MSELKEWRVKEIEKKEESVWNEDKNEYFFYGFEQFNKCSFVEYLWPFSYDLDTGCYHIAWAKYV